MWRWVAKRRCTRLQYWDHERWQKLNKKQPIIMPVKIFERELPKDVPDCNEKTSSRCIQAYEPGHTATQALRLHHNQVHPCVCVNSLQFIWANEMGKNIAAKKRVKTIKGIGIISATVCEANAIIICTKVAKKKETVVCFSRKKSPKTHKKCRLLFLPFRQKSPKSTEEVTLVFYFHGKKPKTHKKCRLLFYFFREKSQ